jgi:hypothetical protein
VNAREAQKLLEFFTEFRDVFGGRTVYHRIGTATLVLCISIPPRRLPLAKRAELKETLKGTKEGAVVDEPDSL